MKIKLLLSTAVLLCLAAGSLRAQHSDVEFGYEYSTPGDTSSTRLGFEIEQDTRTYESYQLFESEFEDPFGTGDFGSDEPGFSSSPGEDLFINSGDQIFLNMLDASAHSTYGQGYVNFYDPTTDAVTAFGRISISDNMGGGLLTLNGGSIESGMGPQFIDIGVSDAVHDHLDFDLLDDATTPLGAYGLLVQLQSDFATVDGTMDLSSDPFWLVFNHGMSESDFDSKALPRFGAIPEPGTASVLLLGSLALVLRRRR